MAGQGRGATPSSSGTPLVLLSCSGTPVLLWCSFWLTGLPRRNPHRDGAGEKQAAALVALACSRKLLPLPAASAPRTVLTRLLIFPASRSCFLLLTRGVPPDRVRWTPDAAHLALTLALAVSQPRREPPGTSAVHRTPELLSSLSSLSCFSG
ncbi:hypothetical protein NDU88_002588 [Pleurodeles waltl]|uniref:Secreted protein n=1 Tax=Pleurodeles waltl TaxID=8319 RepID=A0AAV7LEI8_PLEWA|nr:hypothetical protein NDU88_002588 [Pleurodeles waltl]